MLKQTIKKWNQSLDSYKNGNIGEALSLLKSVDATSKIQYNVGVMYFKNGSYKEAIEAFDRSTDLDKYLAISFFMKGVSYHMMNDTSHAIVNYDETIQKLRGHEYIDYKQLGLEYKLLECEVLFNKSLALGKAGGSVALQAQQCKVMPPDQNIFMDMLRKAAEGQSTAKPRTPPLDILFKPPKVSDQGPPKTVAEISKPTSSLSSTTTKPTPSSSPSTSSSSSSSFKPSLSQSTPSISTTPNKSTPPLPQPSITKKLPSRPTSMKDDDIKLTIKVFYKDRRLIQVSASCSFKLLQEKIGAKFDTTALLYIKYKSGPDPDDWIVIDDNKELKSALSIPITELYLVDDLLDVNQFEKNATYSDGSTSNLSTSPPPPPPKHSTLPRKFTTTTTSFDTPSTPQSKPPSSSILTSSMQQQQSTTTTYKFNNQNNNNNSKNEENGGEVAPPIPNRLHRPTMTTSSPLSGARPPGVSIPKRSGTVTSRYQPQQQQYSTSLPNKSQLKTLNDDAEVELPLKVCFSPSGEKFYLNIDTGKVYWTREEAFSQN